MNIQKTELQAFFNTPHATICSPSGSSLSTLDKHGSPHAYYKYLGIFLFTSPDPNLLFELCLSEINSFFASLSHVPISLPEWVPAVNLILINTLAYRLQAHELAPSQLDTLQTTIWTHLCKHAVLSTVTSPKDRYTSRRIRGLGLFHLPTIVHSHTVNSAQRHLLKQSPPSLHSYMLDTYFGPPPPLPRTISRTLSLFRLGS